MTRMRPRKSRAAGLAMALAALAALVFGGVFAPATWQADVARGRDAIGDGVATLAAMQTGRDLAFASVGEGPSAGLWGTRAYGADVAGLFAGAAAPGRETSAPGQWLGSGRGRPRGSIRA